MRAFARVVGALEVPGSWIPRGTQEPVEPPDPTCGKRPETASLARAGTPRYSRFPAGTPEDATARILPLIEPAP